MRRLKVYGWIGHGREVAELTGKSWLRQSREIMAAASLKAVRAAHGGRNLFNLCETGNDLEIKTAMAEPGAIFWTPLDGAREFGYRKALPTQQKESPKEKA